MDQIFVPVSGMPSIQHDATIQAFVDQLKKANTRFQAITNDTPYHIRALRVAKLIIVLVDRPTSIQATNLGARIYGFVEEIEFVMNYVNIHGLGAWGTNDGEKIRRAIHKSIDAMDAVIEGEVAGCIAIAKEVKEKAESANVLLLMLSMPELHVQLH